MAGKVKGITIEIGGDTTGLSKALSDVNKKSRDVQSELRAVEKALKLNPNSTELLAQKQELLAKSIGQTEDKLEALKRAKEDADKRMASGDTETSAEQYRALQREISNTEKALENLQDESEKTNKEFKAVSKTGKNVSELKTAFGAAVKGAAGFAAAVGGIAVGLSNLEESTREYREDLNKLKAAFAASGKDTVTAKKAYADFYKVLGEEDRAVEAVNHLAELTNNQKELSDWTLIAAGVNAKFTDSLPIEGLTEASNETAKVGRVTGVLADALNWAGESEDTFNEKLAALNTEEERASLITQTLSELYSETGSKYLEMNAGVVANREAQQQWNDSLANLGEAIAPAKAAVVEFGATLANEVATMIAGDAEVNNIVESTDALCNSYKEKAYEIENAATAEIGELERAKDLFEELEELTAAEGELTGKKKERVDFIANELQEKLGIEINTNGDVRDSVKEIKDEVDKLILSKKAEILLEAHKEKAIEAEKKKTEALEAQRIAYDNLLKKEKEAAEEVSQLGNVTYDTAKELYDLKKAYSNASDVVAQYSLDAETYNRAAAEAAKGNIDKVIKLLSEQDKAFITSGDVAEKTAEEQKRILGQQWYDAITEATIAAENYNKVQTEANREVRDAALERLREAREEAEKIGINVTEGFVEGIDGNLYSVEQSAGRLYAAFAGPLTGPKGFIIKSPSRWAKKIARFVVEGFTNEIFDNLDLIEVSAKALSDAFKEEFEDLTEEEEKYLARKKEIEEEAAAEELQRKKDDAKKRLEEAKKEAKSGREIKEAEAEFNRTMRDINNDIELEGLEKAAEIANKRRERIREAFGGMVDDVQKSMDTLKSKMDSFKSGLSSVDLLSESKIFAFRFNGEDFFEDNTILADLSGKRKALEQFKENVIELESIGIDPVMIEQIKTLGAEQGMNLAEALLEATPETREKFIDDFKAIGELSGEATAEVFKDEIQTLASDTKQLFTELNPDLLKVGEDWGTLLGVGIVTKLKEALQGVDDIISFTGTSSSQAPTSQAPTVYITEIVQHIQNATRGVIYEIAENTRRVMENLTNEAVLS